MLKKQLIVTHYTWVCSCYIKYLWCNLAKKLTKELSLLEEEPTEIFIDNKSIITIGKNLAFHDQSKHIDTHYHLIWECIKRKDIQAKYVKSQDQVAVIFTKPLK